MPARQLGLIANSGKPRAAEWVEQLLAAFQKHSLPVALEAHTAHLVGRDSSATMAELAERCELLVVLGGDGTMLKVMHETQYRVPPILGINLGTLGFLTCASLQDWPDAVEDTGTQCLGGPRIVQVRRDDFDGVPVRQKLRAGLLERLDLPTDEDEIRPRLRERPGHRLS